MGKDNTSVVWSFPRYVLFKVRIRWFPTREISRIALVRFAENNVASKACLIFWAGIFFFNLEEILRGTKVYFLALPMTSLRGVTVAFFSSTSGYSMRWW